MPLFLGVFFLGFFVSVKGWATNPYAYTLLGYPKTGISCLETAMALGERLHRSTGASVQRSFCDAEREDTYDLRIVYEAEAELAIVSTEEKLAYAGTYPTRAQCEADLPSHVALFESRTRLKPFLAYCYVDESGLEKTIGTRIDALGTPVEWPQVFQEQVYARPLSPRAVEEGLRAALESARLFPAVVAVLPSAGSTGWYRIVLKYFGVEQIVWRGKADEFFYDSPEQCERQLASTTALLASAGLSPASAFCAWDGTLSRASMNFISRTDSRWYQIEVAGEEFRSLETCLAGQERIVDYFKVTLKRPLFGAVCTMDRLFALSPSQRRFRVELLYPCPSFGAAECQHPL